MDHPREDPQNARTLYNGINFLHLAALPIYSHGISGKNQSKHDVRQAVFHYLVTVTFEWSFAHDRHL